jgi:hypothetical protein
MSTFHKKLSFVETMYSKKVISIIKQPRAQVSHIKNTHFVEIPVHKTIYKLPSVIIIKNIIENKKRFGISNFLV